MDLGFDHHDWAANGWPEQSPGGDARDDSRQPDWPGLRARLMAARAARQQLTHEFHASRAGGSGSFDCRSARSLASLGTVRGSGFTAVNPDCFTNGNAAPDIVQTVAGDPSTGDRG